MPATADELRRVALELFASDGYHATSIQHIADRAGVSKASVLYHYASKEVLLEAAIAPALEQIDALFSAPGDLRSTDRDAFLERFVDLLLEHRLALQIFVNQSAALVDVPVMERATGLIERISSFFQARVDSPEEKLRFGIALGGTAYLLAQKGRLPDFVDDALVRPMLVAVIGELVSTSR